jgi:hypothetical protein
MARRKAPQIADEVLDQLLSGTQASAPLIKAACWTS